MSNMPGDIAILADALSNKKAERWGRNGSNKKYDYDTRSIAQNEETDSIKINAVAFPGRPREEIYHGLVGDIVKMIEPDTESDPIAILGQFHVAFGNAIGRTAYVSIEADKHYANEYVAIVGDSASARKGTAWGYVNKIFELADPEWQKECIKSGLSSGEGVIAAVKDQVVKSEPVKEKGKKTGEYIDVIIEEGAKDKRVLIQETELVVALKQTQRDGNILSAILRNTWDGKKLSTLTKIPSTATDAHVSIVGHITLEELQDSMNMVEMSNGLANRFVWLAVRKSKELPFGGEGVNLAAHVEKLHKTIEFAKKCGKMEWAEDAKKVYREVYHDLSTRPPGFMGKVTARAEAHVIRYAMLYALENQSTIINAEHLLAALAFWEYGYESARWVWGDAIRDEITEKIVDVLSSCENGLSKTEIYKILQGNIEKGRVDKILASLISSGRVTQTEVKTAGRPKIIFMWNT